MRKMKVLLALVLALAFTMSVCSALAASITINRDSSYEGSTGESRNYSYYKIFSATKNGDAVSYTANSTVAGILGSWVAASGTPGEDGYVAAHWQKADGNLWFKLTPISGSENFIVEWDYSSTDDAAAQAAAEWLIAHSAYEAGPTALTFSNGSWTSGTIADGYYVVSGSTGKNLVAATTDISITEKNVYPPLDKTQADEDDTVQSNTERDVAIGDVLTYEVKVTIPDSAKVGDQILVWDKPSGGLHYNDDVAVKTGSNTGNATVADAAAADQVNGAVWNKVITVVAGSQGTEVVFTFTMTVTEAALVDTGKVNESGLKYGHEGDWEYESLPDRVEYKTYYGGIHKVDGVTGEDLAGVKFNLFENGSAFNVQKPDGKDYYVPGGNSNEVVTDSQGRIMIRGLDEDKTYTLTETYALPGYNMLDHNVELTESIDTYAVTDEGGTTTVTESFDATKSNPVYVNVTNNSGTVLPSTGGIGTTLFYVAGIVLVLGAAAVIIARRKAEQE